MRRKKADITVREVCIDKTPILNDAPLRPHIVACSPINDIIAVVGYDLTDTSTGDEILLYKGSSLQGTYKLIQRYEDGLGYTAQMMKYTIVQMEFSCRGVLAVIAAKFNDIRDEFHVPYDATPPTINFLSPLIEYDEGGRVKSYAKWSPPYTLRYDILSYAGISWNASGTKLYFCAYEDEYSFIGYIPPPDAGRPVQQDLVKKFDYESQTWCGEVRNICCTGLGPEVMGQHEAGFIVITGRYIFYFNTETVEGNSMRKAKYVSEFEMVGNKISCSSCCIAWNPVRSCAAVATQGSVHLWTPSNEKAPWKIILDEQNPIYYDYSPSVRSLSWWRCHLHPFIYRVQVAWSPDYSKLAMIYRQPGNEATFNDVILYDPTDKIDLKKNGAIKYPVMLSLKERCNFDGTQRTQRERESELYMIAQENLTHNFAFNPTSGGTITELYVCRGEIIEKWTIGDRVLPFGSDKMMDLLIA